MQQAHLFALAAAVFALAACADPGGGSGHAGRGGKNGEENGGNTVRGGAVGTAGAAGRGPTGAAGAGGRGGAPPASVIVVDTPSGYTATDSSDGYCDIVEAVAAASSGRDVRECAGGAGARRIVLAAGSTYPTPKTLRAGAGVEIGLAEGATGTATITAAGGWAAADPADGASRCLVFVAAAPGAPAVTRLTDVTLSQDPSLDLSGVCITRGALELRRGHVTGFHRSGIVATCLPVSGCDHDANGDDATTVRVLGSLIDRNVSPGNGGGVFSEGSGTTVGIYHSAIVNNTAGEGGGGVYLGGGWGTDILQASTLSGNRASSGGGLLVEFASCTNTYLNVFNGTIAFNTADGAGGGIAFEAADLTCSTQDVSLFASIVAANHSLTTSESNLNADWRGGLFNCFSSSFVSIAAGLPRPSDINSSCTFDVRDARLGPAVPLGGPGDLPAHPLLAGSPALDGAADAQSADDQRDAWIPLVDPGTPDPWTVFDRGVDGDGDGVAVGDLGAIEMNARWQTELLAVAAKGASAHTVVNTPGGYDRGAGTRYDAAGPTEQVTYALPIAEAGDYDFTVRVLEAGDAGQFQMAVADTPRGSWTTLGPTQDAYAATATFAALGPFSGPRFPTAGERFIRFTVTGKNPASAGHQLSLDYIEVKRSTAPCPLRQLVAGAQHTCALLGGSGGGVRCWGDGASGELGDGGKSNRATPPALDVLTGARAITAGAVHTCALTAGGGVRCWGLNSSGQLGDGTTTDRVAPPTTDVLTGVTAIAAGGQHTCALTAGGGVRCWGLNSYGQLGDGTTGDRSAPPAADALAGVMAVAAGSRHTCALTTTGGVRCWGRNEDGELGNGTYLNAATPPATSVLGDVQAVTAGLAFTCALTIGGGVRCWGYNSDGQLGDDTALAVDRTAPAATDVLDHVQEIAVGFAHTCALMTSGGLRCWGANTAGQLGDGLAPDPALTPPPMDAAGFVGTCR